MFCVTNTTLPSSAHPAGSYQLLSVLRLHGWHDAYTAMCICLIQGKAPPSFLMLVVDIVEVDYVHLESDTRAIWKKERGNMANQAGSADSCVWCKEEVNP